jgi:hypothetical protein
MCYSWPKANQSITEVTSPGDTCWVGKVKQLKIECSWQKKKENEEIDIWEIIELEMNIKYDHFHFYKKKKT